MVWKSEETNSGSKCSAGTCAVSRKTFARIYSRLPPVRACVCVFR